MTKRFYSLTHNVLTPAQRAQLVNGILGAPYFGPSALGPEFLKTEGFSLVFRRSHLGTVVEQFPFLEALLQTALFDECNAFYINPLVLYNRSAVEPHIDCRLSEQGLRLIPNLVSVYYAQIDAGMIGGGIVFHPGSADELRVQPASGDLLHFVGNALHCVESVVAGSHRISVVCEQYNLPPTQLDDFPICQVLTGEASLMRANALDH